MVPTTDIETAIDEAPNDAVPGSFGLGMELRSSGFQLGTR
jgi:hypothetical protein